MKVFELSNELNVNNKELITFFKEKGFKVSSHLQNITDEMIDCVNKAIDEYTAQLIEEGII